jgi:hypothetical protein
VRFRARPAWLASSAALALTGLAGCGNTLQDQPVPHNILEEILASRFTVYWLGTSFRGLQIAETVKDPGGAITFHYGNCIQGGGSTCVTPLRIVTSPDNGFVPAGSAPVRTVALRGARATVAAAGTVIEIPTGAVVVDIDADSAGLARSAAARLAPINAVGAPGEALPAALPNTGFGQTPLQSQKPDPLRPIS